MNKIRQSRSSGVVMIVTIICAVGLYVSDNNSFALKTALMALLKILDNQEKTREELLLFRPNEQINSRSETNQAKIKQIKTIV